VRRHDVVVVGAGAAGCVLAARLTENPSLSVLLLESGAERRGPLLSIPAAETLLMGNRRYDWCFETEADPSIDGRSVRIPRGRLLGGSNVINGMIFVRGAREDYDGWARAGNAGWSWEDVLPYFRRLERTAGLGGEARGQDGPMPVVLPRERDGLCDAFLSAARSAGFPANPDYNSGDQEGVGYYQVTQESGRRSSALGSYLNPARRRPNLTVVTDAHVTGVTFDGSRCTGVRYRRGGVDHHVECGREVVLSAGTVQSPQLLELSGIGSADVLARAGVGVVAHLPGVGENFRDHFATRLRWRVSRPVTFNERTHGLRFAREIARYAVTRRGVLSLPIALGFGFVRSAPAEPAPDLQFHFAPASYGPGSSRRLDTAPGMTLGVYPLRPESRGSIHIRSRDATVPPAIRPRFLDADEDRRRLVAGMRLARRIVEDPALDAFRDVELSPGGTVRSDDDLLAHARAHGDTSYHPVGTCRMGTDPMAVVDDRLRVRGVHALRVIDASVMPTMVSGNTNAATLMIAEKGAAMILDDHGVAAPGVATGAA
jgi:choline dehydrogenase